MTEDTTAASYWLNWRFLLCAIWMLCATAISVFLIWKYKRGRNRSSINELAQGEPPAGLLFKGEVWSTCYKGIHPICLLAVRVFSFALMLTLIIGNTVADGPGIFIYYTQWTFTLVTIYFGFASALSIYGCCKFRNETDSKEDTERGTYVAPQLGAYEEGPSLGSKSPEDNPPSDHHNVTPIAGFWEYLLQILYQVGAGAIVLTDVVFWLVIFPFLSGVDFKLSFYVVSMHTVNVVLIIDTLLNNMRFPMFRFGYFLLWTVLFVVVQWISHACVSFDWPYPFLDLSSPYAPVWYMGVGLLHIPCYCVFALIVKLKRMWLSKSFPDSYQGSTR